MSNKLAKNKNVNSKNKNHKKAMFFIALVILCIAFVAVWLNVILTSNSLNDKKNAMVLGKDYFEEEIKIVDKKAETSTDNSISTNYFLYYHYGNTYDYQNRMQVPGKIYEKYSVGDRIKAYTTDHMTYSYEKNGILPKTEYKNNELKKVAGVLLGIMIFTLVMFGILDNKFSK